MQRHGGVIVYAVALLMVLALVAGCLQPSSAPSYQHPKGMGVVKLNFGNTVQRETYLPEDLVVADDLHSFELDFIPTGGSGGQAKSVTHTHLELLTAPIPLVAGEYNLTVVAYLDSDATEAVATGDITFTVTEGVTTEERVILKAYDPAVGTDNGIFAWKISVTNVIFTTATMNVTRIGGSSVLNKNLLETGNMDSSSPLPAGYYYVDFSLEISSLSLNRTFRHVLHIYQNMTSTLEYDFSNDKLGIAAMTISSFKPDFEWDPIINYKPDLDVSAIDITIGGADQTITVTNASDYTSIEWYYNGNDVTNRATPAATRETLVVSTSAAPFNEAGKYQLIVVGFLGTVPDTVPYSAEILVNIIEPIGP
jgi:hypothetical protein